MERQNAEDRGETIYSPIAMVFVFLVGEREFPTYELLFHNNKGNYYLMYTQIIKDYVKKVMCCQVWKTD